jgi:hypothetical protein
MEEATIISLGVYCWQGVNSSGPLTRLELAVHEEFE